LEIVEDWIALGNLFLGNFDGRHAFSSRLLVHDLINKEED
jgi:hypothetical protein